MGSKPAVPLASTNKHRLVSNLYYKHNQFPLNCFQQGEDIAVDWELLDYPSNMTFQVVKSNKLIQQSLKILMVSDARSSVWAGGMTLLEIEIILAVTKVRRHVLSDFVARIFLGKVLDPPSFPVRVRISSIKWPESPGNQLYFMNYFCALFCGTTVYGTNLACLKVENEMAFNGPYKFGNLPPDFQIKAKFYSLNMDEIKANLASTKDVSYPMTRLVAEAVVTADNLKRRYCPVRHVTDKCLPDLFFVHGWVE